MTIASDRLRRLVEAVSPAPISLPLIHITDAYSFAEITEEPVLIPQHCDVFGHEITYMFYGRPAYRTKHNGNIFLSANLPIVFIFHPDRFNSIVQDVYPFDTGAFRIGIYSNFFHGNSKIDHFSLKGLDNAERKLVAYFYRDSEEYYYGSSRQNVEIPQLNFEVEGLFELYRAPADPAANSRLTVDERTSSIEVHFRENIPLADALLGIILPRTLINQDEIKQFLSEVRPRYIETYSPIVKHDKSAIAGTIYKIVEDMYINEGLLRGVSL